MNIDSKKKFNVILQSKGKEEILNQFRYNSNILQYANEELKNDKEFIMKALQIDVLSSLEFASEELINDDEVISRAIDELKSTIHKKDEELFLSNDNQTEKEIDKLDDVLNKLIEYKENSNNKIKYERKEVDLGKNKIEEIILKENNIEEIFEYNENGELKKQYYREENTKNKIGLYQEFEKGQPISMGYYNDNKKEGDWIEFDYKEKIYKANYYSDDNYIGRNLELENEVNKSFSDVLENNNKIENNDFIENLIYERDIILDRENKVKNEKVEIIFNDKDNIHEVTVKDENNIKKFKYQNGEIKEKIYGYTNDDGEFIKNGAYEKYEKGVPVIVGGFKDNCRHGLWTSLDLDGNKIDVKKFNLGEDVTSEKEKLLKKQLGEQFIMGIDSIKNPTLSNGLQYFTKSLKDIIERNKNYKIPNIKLNFEKEPKLLEGEVMEHYCSFYDDGSPKIFAEKAKMKNGKLIFKGKVIEHYDSCMTKGIYEYDKDGKLVNTINEYEDSRNNREKTKKNKDEEKTKNETNKKEIKKENNEEKKLKNKIKSKFNKKNIDIERTI